MYMATGCVCGIAHLPTCLAAAASTACLITVINNEPTEGLVVVFTLVLGVTQTIHGLPLRPLQLPILIEL